MPRQRSPPSGIPQAEPGKGLRYPSRRDIHQAGPTQDSLEEQLLPSSGEFLVVEVEKVEDKSVEDPLVELSEPANSAHGRSDELKVARQELAAYREYVEEVERLREEAETKVAAEIERRDEAREEAAVYQDYLEEHRVLNAYYRQQLMHADITHSVNPGDFRLPEWSPPQSLDAVLEVMRRDDGQRRLRDRVVFTGDRAVVEELAQQDSVGVYAREVWDIIRTLNDYLVAKEEDRSIASVRDYLQDDAIVGYKVAENRNISSESRSIHNRA